MSRENVELFRALVEDYLGGSSESDREGMLTRITALMDPKIEFDASEVPVLDLKGVHRGVEAVLRFLREWFDAWETTQFEYELIDAGDRVVIVLDQRMRGRSTGIEVSLEKFAEVATFRDGLIVHWRLYQRPSDALEAAGLPG
jgi:ketosteroid isomerase-like protein